MLKSLRKTIVSVVELSIRYFKDTIMEYNIWWFIYIPDQILNILLGLASWYYYTLFAAKGIIETTYGGDIISFLIIGIALNPILSSAISLPHMIIRMLYSGFWQSGGVRLSQWAVYYLAKRSKYERAISYFVSEMIINIFSLSLYFFIGFLVFGFKINPNANYLAAFIAFIFGYASCLALGILAACTVWFFIKAPVNVATNPAVWFLSQLPTILSGVYFPVDVLPGWLRVIGYYFPQTYTFSAVRHALLGGSSFNELLPEIIKLILYSTLLPISILIYKKVERYMIRKVL
jgi:ABC-type multidrug transport system permease subunit